MTTAIIGPIQNATTAQKAHELAGQHRCGKAGCEAPDKPKSKKRHHCFAEAMTSQISPTTASLT